MQYFAPQLHRDRQHRKTRRAPRDQEDSDHGRPSSPESDAEWTSRALPADASNPSFASPGLAQLRVAGLLPADEHRVPPSPFPHAPAPASRPYVGSASIHAELAAAPSRLYPVHSAAQGDGTSSHAEARNLRRTHLNVLSTVLHRCLQERDYDRAGRAWGMILRTQATHGHAVDLRNHGRWGIGAEILLRRKPHALADEHGVPAFSEQGFELAREYYERLIVQHPARKQAPHAVDQRTFYPAMFSLWIQQVAEKSKLEEDQNAAVNSQLASAMEIAARLDDLVKSPPFDKQASLLQLRGNTALWISDLLVGNSPAAPLDEWDPYPIRSGVAPADQIARFTSCQRELGTALAFLRRVQENGGPGQAKQMRKIEGRRRDLATQIARLEEAGDQTESDVTMDAETI